MKENPSKSKSIPTLSLHLADKQRGQQQEVAAPLLFSYAKEHAFLASALIEMLNNEPNLQEVPLYRNKTRDSDDQRETCDIHSQVHDSTVTYAVGETVFTGKFNLKVRSCTNHGCKLIINIIKTRRKHTLSFKPVISIVQPFLSNSTFEFGSFPLKFSTCHYYLRVPQNWHFLGRRQMVRSILRFLISVSYVFFNQKSSNNRYANYSRLSFEPRCEKTGLRGFRPGPTQTRL